MNLRYAAPLFSLTASAFVNAQVQPTKLELSKGNSIAIVGNTLGDRQQHYGWLESMIYKTYPQLDLTVRNLANAADELTVRIRSMDVPKSDEWLTKAKADVIFAYFGFNESFKGTDGVAKFKTDLEKFIDDTLAQKYNGTSAPKLVLFSPIGHEDFKSPDFPNGEENNKNIALYTAAMSEVAKAKGVQFVDLFTPSKAAYAASGGKHLTVNGIHLNELGDELIAGVQFKGLFGTEAPKVTDPAMVKLRQAVLDKNYEWHHRYRTVDQYNIYGQRGHIAYKEKSAPGEGVTNNTTLLQEMSQRDILTANRDKRIWAIAKGGDLKIDDSNIGKVDPVPPNKNDVAPYLDPEEAIKHMKVPAGCKVELVASEKSFPEMINPVQMNWDTKGRLWISAWPTYPEALPADREGDHLLVLDLDPKTGKATKATKFASGLNCPTGFQFYKDGVILIQSPDLWFIKDTDGDGKADFKERILNGLDAADSHHETNSMCVEPGGAIYCSDGVFHRTNVETYNGPVRNQDGCIYRFEPNTGKFERYIPYGFANPHGRVFDYWGNDIVTDATGNANYFGPAFSGHLDEGKHPGMQEFWKRPSRPTPGTNILTSAHFPEDWQGNFLNCNVISFQGIWRVKVTEQGSGLLGETISEDLVSSDDPNFRPSAVSVAPDGSIYFCDWSQQLIGHLQHHLRDPNRDHMHGRIYRITYEGRPLQEVKKIDGQPVAKLLDLLKEPQNDVRQRAKLELSKHDRSEVIPAVQAWAKQFDPTKVTDAHHLLEALWVHQWNNVVNQPLIEALLKSPEPRARAQAIRVICYQRDRIPNALELLKVAANDSAPRVRLEAIRAASFFNGADVAKALDIVYSTLKYESDYYLNYCYKETVKQLQSLNKTKSLPADPEIAALVIAKMDDKELAGQPAEESVLLARLERKSYDIATREKFLGQLITLRKSSRVAEILGNLQRLDAKGGSVAPAATELGKLLVATPPAELGAAREAIAKTATSAKLPQVRKAAWGALLLADGKGDTVWSATEGNAGERESLLQGLGLVLDPTIRSGFQTKLSELLTSGKASGGVLKAALAALPLMGADNAAANFKVLAKFLHEGTERGTVVDAINQLPRAAWDKSLADPLAKDILTFAKTVDAKKRSDQDFVELNQLGMEMATLAGNADVRKELRGLGVSVFVVKTVREQLKYDTARLVVEKGKPFEVVFENSDVMPHNFVIVEPGKHLEIGQAAMTMTPDIKDKQGRQYLPKGFTPIAASQLLEPGEKEKLQVKAPNQEGEYEYVCTFPGHAVIMWGKLVVTKDVEAYLAANPN